MNSQKTLLNLLLLLLLAAGSLVAQRREKPYVIIKMPQGTRKVDCRSIQADANGRLTAVLENGATNNFARGAYVVAVIPRPEDVDQLDDLLDEEKYNRLVEVAPAVFSKYKFLGYADEIARIHCEALMELKRFDEAKKVFEEASKCPRADEFNLASIRMTQMIYDKKTKEVEAQLTKLLQREDDAISAFVYLMRGRIFEVNNQKKEAVLQYLKAFMSFEDRKKVRRFRKQAKSSALRLMKELNDPLAKSLEALK